METAREPRFFYGWLIVAYVVANAIVISGAAFLSIGVFVRPLEEEFGWSRGQITAAFGTSILLAGLFGPFAGRFVDRRGAKLSFLIGLVGMAICFVLLAGVRSLWQLYAVFALMSFFRPFASYLAGSVLLARWFRRRRATVLGLVAAGYSLGGLLVPLTAFVIGQWGVSAGFLFDAALLAALLVPMLLIVRERPEDMGTVPDGTTFSHEDAMPHGQRTIPAPEREFTLSEAARSRAFWFLTLAFAMLFTSQTAFLIHGVPFFESAGYATATATLVMLALTLTTGAIRSVLGILIDRVAYPHRLAAVLACSMAFGLAVLAINTQAVAVALFLPFFAVGMAGGPVFEPVLFLRGFGAKHFGAILGLAGVVETFGSFLGPTFAGFMYDATGNYTATFAIFAAIFVAAALLFIGAGRTARADAAAALPPKAAAV